MSGILDFLGNLPGYLADAFPHSVFGNVQAADQMRRGLADAQNSFFGKPADQVQVTPQVGSLPSEQAPGAGIDYSARQPMYQQSAPTPGLVDQLPQAQQPFIKALALSAGIPDAAKQAMDYNIQKPMTQYEQGELNKPVFGAPGSTGYTRDASGNYNATIPGKQARPATAEEKTQYGLSPDTPAQIDAQGVFRPIAQPAQPNLSGPQSDAQALGLVPGSKEYTDYIRQRTLPKDSADTGWQFLNDPANNNMPYRANARTGQILDLAGNPYKPIGMGRLAGGNSGQLFTPDQAKLFAQQALAGDRSVFSTVGRNSAARTQIAQAMADMAKEQNLNGVDIATINAAFLGDQQAQRTIGTRTGAIAVSGQEAKGVANLVNDAYSKLPRADFRPFNQLRSLYETQTSSPEQAAAYLADFSLQTAYGRALNPQGVPRESDIERAGQLLNGAQSQEAHKAVVDQILKEVGVIQDSTGAARVQAINRIRNERGFGSIAPAAGGAAPPPAAAPKVGGVIRYDSKGKRIN